LMVFRPGIPAQFDPSLAELSTDIPAHIDPPSLLPVGI
jgi:hypothetical protein